MDSKLQTAIDMYVASAIVHGECTENGDYKRGNRAFDENLKALKIIRKAGKEGNQALLQLLDYRDSGSVRVAAATHLLKVNKKRATKVLKRVAKEEGLVAFDAEMVLEEWRKGSFRDPLEGETSEEERRSAEGRATNVRVSDEPKHSPVDDILDFAATLPMQVPVHEITELDELEERVALAMPACGDFFGIGSHFAELCLDYDEEPSMAVRLAWAWVVRPDLDEQIAPHANKTLRDSMTYYRS